MIKVLHLYLKVLVDTHLYGVQHRAEVHAQGRIGHIERVGEVQGYGHISGVNSLLVHCFILQQT